MRSCVLLERPTSAAEQLSKPVSLRTRIKQLYPKSFCTHCEGQKRFLTVRKTTSPFIPLLTRIPEREEAWSGCYNLSIMGPRRDSAPAVGDLSEAQHQQVRMVLETLLQSTVFGSAHRGRRFLRYIVEEALKGNRDGLKERTIGVEVFERTPEYSTGDDAVVRVQAGDVSKRLERFFAQPEAGTLPVEILLPIGTYCPEFLFRKFESPTTEQMAPHSAPSDPSTQTLITGTPASVSPEITHPVLEQEFSKPSRFSPKSIFRFAVVIILCLIPLGWWVTRSHSANAFQEFWAPVTSARHPVLLCVAKAAPYYPSRQFLIEHGATRTGEFNTEWQRMGKPFNLPPEQPLHWGDLVEMSEFGVATGDVYSAVQLSLAFAHMNKDSQLRVGSGYQFEDLRGSPSVLIGAFNNRWTMLIGAGLPYRFFEDNTTIGIEESGGARRRWRLSSLESRRQQDFAIVARLLNTETGQPVIIVGGIGASGTQAATEFVTDSQELTLALGKLPREWPNRNVEFVISTKVTDGIAGPSSVVASAVW